MNIDTNTRETRATRNARRAAENCYGQIDSVVDTKPAPDVMDAFPDRYAEVHDQIAKLHEMAEDHFGYVADDINWTHVAELNRMAERLTEVLASINSAR